MKKLFITILTLVVSSKLLWCQSDTIRTATSIKVVSKSPGQKKINISEEDTLISTPNSVMVVKKRDYYMKKDITGRKILIDKGDSVITTPLYIKVLRKKESSKRQ
ncbi:MAG: hypothetical protein KatS3mg028_1594 [Bacteroidia bacterium]|nr:MAG: hypothetical protein KatS3mg028_1594 [Bacteroidia bacterium]